MVDRNTAEIVLRLGSPAELFDGPAAAARPLPESDRQSWDDIGAILGQAGVARLLRLVYTHPRATRLLVQVAADGSSPERAAGELEARLRLWCQAKLAANRSQIRAIRIVALRTLAACLALLAVAFLAASTLQSESIFPGEPGPLRKLASEAIVIAGWVVMWRPFESLIFDPLEPKRESRMIRRLLALTWRIEVREPGTPSRAG